MKLNSMTITEIKTYLEQNYYKDKSGCWIWTGAFTVKGEPRCRIKYKNLFKTQYSRIWSYFIYTGEYPQTFLKRLCYNKSCINPYHHFLRTIENYLKFYTLDDNGCHNYRGACNSEGYAIFNVNGKSTRISRYLLETKKRKLTNKELACHTCDNPKCINVKHLFIGTHAINNLDCKIKGRNKHPKGENHYYSVLKEEDAKRIKYGKEKVKYLAELFKIKENTVRQIRRNETWKHI